MDSSQKFFTTFDKFLFGGLGCGVLGICLLGIAFVYTFRNPPRPRPSETPVGYTALPSATFDPSTSPSQGTPTFSIFTPSPFPTFTVTPEGNFPTPTAGANFGNTPPTGKIVFTCFVNQVDQICLMNADGSGRKQLTDFDATTFYASLSPDGQTIYFVSRKDGTFDIYSMNTKGKALEKLTKGIGTLYAPELSSGGRIVFTNNGNGIWIMRPDGKNPHAITNRDDIDPTWSPDGSLIAFASSRSGDRQLYIMDKDGTDITQITDLNNMGGRSTWSPDGTKLAFYRGTEGDHNIFVVDIASKEVTRITDGGDNLGPSWSPDGNWIAFTSFRDGNNEIYIVHPDGSGLTRLTNNPGSDWQPRWGR